MLKVDRADFCPGHHPYEDIPMPIGWNATISAPHMHALALEESHSVLQKDGAKILDVGSGSGYLSACFAELVKPNGRVIGLDHIDGLVEVSIKNTQKSHGNLLSSGILKFVVGDGRQGYPEEAPYDVIHVGAACNRVPKALIDQLAAGGIMIIPVGEAFQFIKVIGKKDNGELWTRLGDAVRFVPLTDKTQQLSMTYI